MQLTHIALWTNHLERLRDFYVKYFNGKSNEKYVNPKKGFASYFVSLRVAPLWRSCNGKILMRLTTRIISAWLIWLFMRIRRSKWIK